jgi:ubiquinone/menaquinone biosynthesis C-methylase UbiE
MTRLATISHAPNTNATRLTVVDYVLGSTPHEHRRLMSQARLVEPYTERFLRDAGISEGDHVLDLGCGMGDVSMILARLVGPGGAVTGVDRDALALDAARSRVAAVGYGNVEFVQTDIADIASAQSFDAIVGRMVLIFQPDPAGVLRCLMRHVRPRGLIAFQEPCWSIWRPLQRDLPLRSACIALAQETMLRAGAHGDMERRLYRDFVSAGFPAPQLRLEIPIGHKDRASRDLAYDMVRTVHSQAVATGLSMEAVGDLDTLGERLEAELAEADVFPSWVGLVGAWARCPT